MGKLFTEKQKKSFLNYIGVYEIFLIVRPTMGFYSNYGKITVQMADNRCGFPSVLRTVTSNSNMAFECHLALDFFVHKENIEDIDLIVSFPNSPFRENTVWASMKAQVSFKQSSEALGPAITHTSGFAILPVSAVSKLRSDPMSLDLCVDQNNIDTLQNMHARGELRDLTAVGSEQIVGKYGGSVAGDSVQFSDGDNELAEANKNKIINYQQSLIDRKEEIVNIPSDPSAPYDVPVPKTTANSTQPFGKLKNVEGKSFKTVGFAGEKTSIEHQKTIHETCLVSFLRANFPHIKLDGTEKCLNDINNFFNIRASMTKEDLGTSVHINFTDKIVSHVEFDGSIEMFFGEFCKSYANIEFI